MTGPSSRFCAASATRNLKHFEDLPTPVVGPWA